MPSDSSAIVARLIRQGWISLSLWIAFGILIEGLIGFRIPALMDDSIRREMLRLAHAHGTLLNLVLITAAICGRLGLLGIQPLTATILRVAVVTLPLGFLVGGIWHYRDDPGLGIVLVPVGALLLLFAGLSLGLSSDKARRDGAGGRLRQDR